MNSRCSTSLARILSECRKYHLHLGLAHQTITQLPGARIQGALENARLKIIFGTGRQTAESIVKELFMPNLKAVKHEVKDPAAVDRTHPVFDPMLEQFERATQMIQRLRRRKVLVKLPDRERVYRLRVPNVPPSRLGTRQLEGIKKALAKAAGKPCATVEQEIVRRAKRHGVPFYVRGSQASAEIKEEVWQ
jgi:hypothetical protein